MTRSLRSLVLVFAVTVAALVPVHPSAAGAQEPGVERAAEQEFYGLINDLRISVGLAPLAVNAELVAGARNWTDELVGINSLRHAGDLSIGVNSPWALLGENVGYSSRSVESLFNAFVASPTHYANLVEPTFDHVGVGVVYAPNGRIFTVHRFMNLTDSSPLLGESLDPGSIILFGDISRFVETQSQLEQVGL